MHNKTTAHVRYTRRLFQKKQVNHLLILLSMSMNSMNMDNPTTDSSNAHEEAKATATQVTATNSNEGKEIENSAMNAIDCCDCSPDPENHCSPLEELTPPTKRQNSEATSDTTKTEDAVTVRSSSETTDHPRRRTFTWELVHEMIAEMSGTFVIVQMGTGAVMSSIYKPPDGGGISNDLVSIAIVWIIAVTIAISISASISGAHLNPAITLAFVMVRRESTIGWSKVVPYIVAQFTGAILGSLVNFYIYYDAIQQYEITNGIIRSSSNSIPSAKAFGEYYSTTEFRAFFVEAFGTFVLAVVVFALTHPTNDLINKKDGSNVFVPPLIGCTVGALISTLAPITQAGFNPARDFGPRFVAYFAGWTSVAFLPQYSWLVYILGPIIGAILGATYVDWILFRQKNGARNDAE